MAPTRGFLFADLRDYTSYVEAHGDHAGARLLDRYRRLVRGAIASGHGAEIRTEGDSFYVVFPSASAAVRAGRAILAAAAAAPDVPIRVGVGVHAGEAVETAEGFVGSAVNIAARICSQAKAGELLVSDVVRGLTRTFLDLDFESIGARRLKGIDEPIALYRVVPRAPMGRRRAARAARHRWPWLAVAMAFVLVGAAALGIDVLQGRGGGATASPAGGATPTPATGSAGATGQPSGSAGPDSSPTIAEQELLARIPSGFQAYCRRASLADGALAGSAMIRCDLPVDSAPEFAADTVWYDWFDEPGRMAAAVSGVKETERLASGTCTLERTDVIGPWSRGTSYDGVQGCYRDASGAWMMWTYEGDNIAVRAVRRDRDVATLYSWWRDYGRLLRG